MNIIQSLKKNLNVNKALASFPLTIICSLIATALAISVIAQDLSESHQLTRLAYLSAAGISVFFALEIYSKNILFQLAGLVYLLLFFFLFFNDKDLFRNNYTLIQFGIFVLINHLLAALSGSIHWNLWNYNKQLLINIFISLLYSLTLFVGLSIAIKGVEVLFEVNIPDKLFGYLFMILNILLNTLFFTAMFSEEKMADQEYPKFLKYFATYVLLGLTTLYTLILLCYGLKILTTSHLPEGWVSYMVFSNAILGILSFLLLNPLRKSSRWIDQFSHIYFWVLLPLLILLASAIFVRINQYGLTFSRVLIIGLGLWLLGISLYYILSKKDLIIIVPASLLGVLFIVGLSPINGFVLSKWQQKNTLDSYLKNAQNLNPNQLSRLNASIDYFSQHDIKVLSQYLPDQLAKSFNSFKVEEFRKYFNVPEVKTEISTTKNYYYNFATIDTKDYDFIIPDFNNNSDFLLPDLGEIQTHSDGRNLILLLQGEQLVFDLSKMIQSDNYEQELISEGQTKQFKVKLVLKNLTITESKEVHAYGYLLLKQK